MTGLASAWRNWGRTASCRPDRYYTPSTEDELREMVAEHAGSETIRVAGSGHSFSPVVPSDEVLVSLEEYTGVTAVDYENRRATVRAGTTLRELSRTLSEHGLALENMGDIDRQTVAGALATGTHGTGIDLGVLATQAVEIRLIDADGQVRTLSADDGDAFRAAQVSLGALGVVSEITLAVEPAYNLRERTWTAPVEDVLGQLEELRESHRHFEFFWFPHTGKALIKTLEKTDAEGSSGRLEALGERAENVAWGSLCRLSTQVPSASPSLGKFAAATLSGGETVGPSHEVFATTRDVRFAEAEYGVPAEDGADVVRDLREYVRENEPTVMFPIEFRYVAGDEIPLSPAYGRDTAFLAVHKYYRKPYRDYIEACESIFDRYEGRPHWGKLHYLEPDRLRARYPEWETFESVRQSFDPEGAFLNDHLEALFGDGA